jgi:hypothetical protein
VRLERKEITQLGCEKYFLQDDILSAFGDAVIMFLPNTGRAPEETPTTPWTAQDLDL